MPFSSSFSEHMFISSLLSKWLTKLGDICIVFCLFFLDQSFYYQETFQLDLLPSWWHFFAVWGYHTYMLLTHLQLSYLKCFLLTFIFSMCRLLGNVPLKEHIYGNLVSMSIKVWCSKRSEGVAILDIYSCNRSY